MMLISLYTSRIVLEALGVSDFGIYNVVGGVVALLSFFTSSLTNATQRFFNIGLAIENRDLTKAYFNSSVILFFILSIILVIVGETLGAWFVNNYLNIGSAREYAAKWVYQAALVSVIASINQVPFLSAIIANEKMSFYAYLGLYEAVSKLALSYALLHIKTADVLILYAQLMMAVSISVYIIELIYCRVKFQECRFRFIWDKVKIHELIGFIYKNLYGTIAWAIGFQGTNIVLNIFFGPVVNAARAIAVQVQTAVLRFIENLSTAVKPQIIKSFVTNKNDYFLNLSLNFALYALLLYNAIAIPIFFNAGYILHLWLKDVPVYCEGFVQLTLVAAVFNVLVIPFWIISNATGKIVRNQVYGRTFNLLILPASWLALKCGCSPYIVFIIGIVGDALYYLYVAWDVYDQIHFPIKLYLKRVIITGVIICAPALILSWAESYFIEKSLLQIILVALSNFVVMAILTYRLGLDKEIKEKIKLMIREKIRI